MCMIRESCPKMRSSFTDIGLETLGINSQMPKSYFRIMMRGMN
jgi:hypothetical protein